MPWGVLYRGTRGACFGCPYYQQPATPACQDEPRRGQHDDSPPSRYPGPGLADCIVAKTRVRWSSVERAAVLSGLVPYVIHEGTAPGDPGTAAPDGEGNEHD